MHLRKTGCSGSHPNAISESCLEPPARNLSWYVDSSELLSALLWIHTVMLKYWIIIIRLQQRDFLKKCVLDQTALQVEFEV